MCFYHCRVETQSKTLPTSPKLKAAAEEKDKDRDKKKSSTDRESSPKHHGISKLFRRVGNRRSQSIQEFDIKNKDDKKGTKKGAKISFPVRSKDTLSLVSIVTVVMRFEKSGSLSRKSHAPYAYDSLDKG